MLQLIEIARSYGLGGAPVSALRSVSLTVEEGEFLALLGPSGSGKSTLMNVMGLLDRPTSGRLLFQNVDVSAVNQTEAALIRNKTHGFVFQSFQLLPRLPAWENVALPLLYRGVSKADRQAPALEMLERVGLSDRADHRPEALSGGQKQRVAIARALVGRPKLIFADEPTGSLDSETASEVMALFGELNATLGVTIVMVTHDRVLAKRCHRQVELLDGRIVADSGRAAAE